MEAVIWPQVTQNFYTNGNPMRAAFLSSLANLGILIGGFVGGCFAKPIGQQKYQITFFMALGGALLAGDCIRYIQKKSFTNYYSCVYGLSLQSSSIGCSFLLRSVLHGLCCRHCP